MRKKLLQYCFLILILIVTITYAAQAAISIAKYASLSVSVPATVEKWEIKETQANVYALQASYTYNFHNKQFKTEGFLKKTFPNPWAASKAHESISNKSWNAWLNPKSPEISSLEKSFPKKKTFSAIILLVILSYFCGLGLYLKLKTKAS